MNQWIFSWYVHSHHQSHHGDPTHSPAECLTTQKTDGPSRLHTPRPDMQFISWKTCRRAKGGRTSCLVSLHQPLLSMLCLGSFHPPADRRVYMGPLVKDPRHSHPESFHSAPSSSRLRGRSDRQAQQDRELWCYLLYVCICAWLCDCYYHGVLMC